MNFRRCASLNKAAGQSVVELALVMTLLVPLVLGVFDVSRAIHARIAVVNMSREGASLASRTTIVPQDIMDSLAQAPTAQSLDMAKDGMMYITKVTGVSGVPTVKSQTAWQKNTGPSSQVDPNNLSAVLGTTTIPPGKIISIFEVVYQYRSLFTAPLTLTSVTIFINEQLEP